MDLFVVELFYFIGLFFVGFYLGFLVVLWCVGSCCEFVDLVVYVMCVLGIFCGIDYMVMCGDNNVLYFWNFILDKDGKMYIMEFFDFNWKWVVSMYNFKVKVYWNMYGLNWKDVKR